MGSYEKILFVYVMTFAIAFFVSLLIWVIAGIVAYFSDREKDKDISILKKIGISYTSWIRNQKEIYKYVHSSLGANQEIFNYHHGKY